MFWQFIKTLKINENAKKQQTSISISIIISVYNHIDWLQMIFTMLEKQTFKQFEVILADDGSNEESVAVIKKLIAESSFPVKHIWQKDNGWRKEIVLNKAIVEASSPYLIFLDGDCIPDKHFVSDHYTLQQHGYVVACRSVQIPKEMSDTLTPQLIEEDILSHSFFKLLFSKERHAENVVRIPQCWFRTKFIHPKKGLLLGCNFGIYKEDLLKANGFDERFLSPAIGEDTDLEARLERVGIHTLRYKFICRVYHRYHRSAGFDCDDNNSKLLQWNKDHNIGFTPFGIVKNE